MPAWWPSAVSRGGSGTDARQTRGPDGVADLGGDVERLRSALAAYNTEGPDAILELLDPDVEWIADGSDMGRVTYHARQGLSKAFEELRPALEAEGLS